MACCLVKHRDYFTFTLPPFIAEVKNLWRCITIPIRLHGVVLS